MKVRAGFVSNSSSSSFVISLDVITGRQLKQIKSHRIKGAEFDLPCQESDAWDISLTDTEVRGWTSMDNFNMDHFLTAIGVDPGDVRWAEWPEWDY